MSYTPRHAKPIAVKSATLRSHHGPFGITDAPSGRHARTAVPPQREPAATSADAVGVAVATPGRRRTARKAA
jgi:hypothetical protein